MINWKKVKKIDTLTLELAIKPDIPASLSGRIFTKEAYDKSMIQYMPRILNGTSFVMLGLPPSRDMIESTQIKPNQIHSVITSMDYVNATIRPINQHNYDTLQSQMKHMKFVLAMNCIGEIDDSNPPIVDKLFTIVSFSIVLKSTI